ncbi:hypothetical protein D3C85_929230 [compost metagenome]
MRLFDVGRVFRNRQHVEPECAAFLGNRVHDVYAFLGFSSAVAGLEHVAGEPDRDADIAVGQVRDVFGRVEIRHVRPHREQLGFGLFVVFRVGAVGIQAHVVEDRRHHLVGGVEERHAAFAQLLDVFRLEHRSPGIDFVDAQRSLDLFRVVTDAVGAPQIRHGVQVARIVLLQTLEQYRVEVRVVRQLRLVELLERAGLDLLAEEVVGRHDHVVTGTPGQQLAFQGFVGIENVINRFDPGLFLEVGQGGLADVVRPVINMHGTGGLDTDSNCQPGTHQHGIAQHRKNRQVEVL